MINIESYLICGDDFSREITALEAYMDSLQYDMAMESDTGSSDEPDGTRLRASYGKLSQAINSKDERKINEAKAEVANASAEVDQKVKDPERKKKIIKIAIAAASAAALTVGAIVVANDLKKGDASKLRGAADVMKSTVSKMINSSYRKKKIPKLNGYVGKSNIPSNWQEQMQAIYKDELNSADPTKNVAIISDPETLAKVNIPAGKIVLASTDEKDNIVGKVKYLSSVDQKVIDLLKDRDGFVLIRKNV